MAIGRPRVHDREKIAEELIEWARKEDSINFNKFCCTREPPIPVTKLLDWSSENTEEGKRFRVAYETAKAFIASRREEWLSGERLHVKAYDLNATAYDLMTKHEKIENMKLESSLRKNENESNGPQIVIIPESMAAGISPEKLSAILNKGSK